MDDQKLLVTVEQAFILLNDKLLVGNLCNSSKKIVVIRSCVNYYRYNSNRNSVSRKS